MFGLGSVTDPFGRSRVSQIASAINDFPPGNRALRRVEIPSGQRVKVFVGVGQSNIANTVSAKHTFTNPAVVDNFNMFDGGLYAAEDPLLGAQPYGGQGNWLSWFADKLIAADYCDRVILAPIALGSTTAARWAPGGDMYHSLLMVCKRLATAGLPVSAFLWQQGESDRGTTQAAYQSSVGAMISAIRAAGYDEPWLLGKSTASTGVSQDANIAAAINALVNGTDIFAGADTDELVGSTYRADGAHFNPTGADAAASLWVAKVQAAGV